MERLSRPALAGSLLAGIGIAVAAGLLVAPRTAADEGRAAAKKTEWNPTPINKEVPDFETKDLDGKPFRLSTARAIDKDVAFAAVADAAKARGAKEPKREDPIDGLQGVKGDAEERKAFIQQAGRPYGLIAADETGKDWKTLGEVADWVAGAADAPMVLLVWSSKCPTSREYEPRIVEIFGKTGARLYPVASTGSGETDEESKGFLEAEGLPYRVLLDRDQAICDRLGGLRTPHAFLLDKRNRLRYAGAIDSDPGMEQDDAAARRNYLLDAIQQVKEGPEVDVWMTAPKG